MAGTRAAPLNASVRLPVLVPHVEGSARLSSANNCSLRFRGTPVAVVRATPSGVRAVTVIASSRPDTGCVNRQRQVNHQVPRSRSNSGRRPRGHPSSLVSSGSSVRLGGVCRCRRGRVARSVHSHRCPSFEANRSAPQGLYCSVQSAYGSFNMRQPNYALERKLVWRRNHRRLRVAAQRER